MDWNGKKTTEKADDKKYNTEGWVKPVDPSGNEEIQKDISDITGGGPKPTNINITIGKFQDSIQVYANNLDESLEEIEDKIVSRLLQVVNRANQLQGV